MTPDEVRMLDNRYALLFIRGERPVEDLKFDILKHPNIALTTDGGAEPYRHGEDSISIAALSIDESLLKTAGAEPVSEDEYLFFCEEELEELLQKKHTFRYLYERHSSPVPPASGFGACSSSTWQAPCGYEEYLPPHAES